MKDKTFSVLTVSKRQGWEETAVGSIWRQTEIPEKWVVVSPLRYTRLLLEDLDDGLLDFYYEPENDRPSKLNASLNEGLRHIDTDYVIFYQDFIDLPENCFEKLLALADEDTFVATCTPNYDGSNDSRWTGTDKPRNCRPAEWETNVALAPMRAMRDIGGYEEELDEGWSWDNVLVAEKAAMLGYNFILDESNRPTLLPHEMESRKSLELNGERCYRILREIERSERPLKSKYL